MNATKIKTKKLINDVSTVEHELLHVMGFSRDMFAYFPNTSSDQKVYREGENGRMFYRGDHFIKEVQKHFRCDSITESKSLCFGNFKLNWRTSSPLLVRISNECFLETRSWFQKMFSLPN
jgi:hypothetical protein